MSGVKARLRPSCRLVFSIGFVLALLQSPTETAAARFSVSVFAADITIPIGHRCMGVLPTKAQRIDDELEARGFVLQGGDQPVVLVTLDWCELRNDAFERWRTRLAEAAGTSPQAVLVACLHQHDAPVCDLAAQKLLDRVGLEKELCDPEFHEACIDRVCAAVDASLKSPRAVTHIGLCQARVDKVASNRRVVRDGQVEFSRYSSSGADPFHKTAADGLIDPFLKTISFWDGDSPILALHCYATHPMSYYGKGGVSADFVGQARRLRQAETPDTFQMYATGCSGDVTAGKYNDGSPAMRGILADRLRAAMRAAWGEVQRVPLQTVDLRNTTLRLPFHEGADFTTSALKAELENPELKTETRILAAMGLSSRQRWEREEPIDVPCLDLGAAQIVLLPGEAFVGYQLLAQKLSPETFVMTIGYGEGWTGYIPTKAAFDDGFGHGWRWVGRGSEARIQAALERVLPAPDASKD